jgi:CTP synthase (UTP-ammonia lyase)
MRIALIGDYSPAVPAHLAIQVALRAAARSLDLTVESQWVSTEHVRVHGISALDGCEAVWCVPGSPYASMGGALTAIRHARETRRPFLGTCGGFQHAIVEYARNVAGIEDADHAESNPNAAAPVIVPLACSLVGAEGRIILRPGSRATTIYGRAESVERYHCSYGVSAEYRQRLLTGPLRISGWDEGWDVRIVELDDHPFFLATLFQPELSSTEHEAHPLIVAFVAAAREGALASGTRPPTWGLRSRERDGSPGVADLSS